MAASSSGPDRPRLLLGRVLRPAAADRRARGVGGRAGGGLHGPAAAPGVRAGAGRARGPGGAHAWTALSLLWTPVAGATVDDLQRLLLYLGYAAGGAALFAQPWMVRALEPALAAGALLVTGYGLSERLLPDLVDLDASVTAGGRLEQPLTYWNATGALAAIGLVLCVRMAGDPRRRRGAARAAAAAGAVPLATGVYLSFSRGALAALAVGVGGAPGAGARGRAQAARPRRVACCQARRPPCSQARCPPCARWRAACGSRRAQGLAMLLAMGALAAAAALLTLRAAPPRTPGGRLAAASPRRGPGGRRGAAPGRRARRRRVRGPAGVQQPRVRRYRRPPGLSRLEPLLVLARRARHLRRPPRAGDRLGRIRGRLAPGA